MTDIAAGMATILDWLCRAIAHRGGRDPSITPLIVLVWGHVRRTAARLDALILKFRAGTLPAPRPPRAPRPKPSGPASTETTVPDKKPRLPGGFGWLGQLIPEARPFGSQIQHLLTDPEMQALLAASPQAGRLIRPLCRMLGVRPGPDLQLPPPPSRPRRAQADPSCPENPPPGECEPVARRRVVRPGSRRFGFFLRRPW